MAKFGMKQHGKKHTGKVPAKAPDPGKVTGKDAKSAAPPANPMAGLDQKPLGVLADAADGLVKKKAKQFGPTH
jgi:hypothetical protein